MLCLPSNFHLHEMSHKKESIIWKEMLEKCEVVKSSWWHMKKKYLLRRYINLVIQHEISCQVFKSEIKWYHRVENEKKIFWRKYSVNTVTDPAIVHFGCASSSSQSKKECDTLIRGRQAYCLFSLCYIVQFC